MVEPIEGLRSTVSGQELQALAIKQAGFHKRRAAFYEAEYARYAEVEEDNPNPDQPKYSGWVNPKDHAKAKIREHKQQAKVLEFFAAHVLLDRDYLLNNGDLSHLGVQY